MRNSYRSPNNQESEESAFISMTDLTVSVLFIVMILLAFFASQYASTDMVPKTEFDRAISERDDARTQRDQKIEELGEAVRERDKVTKERDHLLRLISVLRIDLNRLEGLLALEKERSTDLEIQIVQLRQRISALEDELRRALSYIHDLEGQIEVLRARVLLVYLANISKAREALLRELRRQITVEFPDLEIEISADQDALRFKGQALFESGQTAIIPDKIPRIRRVAEILNEMLPCYTFGELAKPSESCNPYFAAIEAVQIEGHTDAEGDDLFNLRLSAGRAVETLRAMIDHVVSLTKHVNVSGQPVISAAAYGEWRPVADNRSREGRDANRRIDVRIIMTRPVSEEEVSFIRRQLSGDALTPLR